ncbi:MAG: hypothetical protein WC467_04385 [Patescibacteria group bacterium]
MKEPVNSPKHFHESIVGVIEKCKDTDAPLLIDLITGTKIVNNYDAIVWALSKKAAVFGKAYIDLVNSVILQKTNDYHLFMNDADNLEQALEFGFEFLPLGSEYLGPRRKIRLMRNCLVTGSPMVAEIAVIDAEANDRRIVLTAAWGKDDKIYRFQKNWPGDIKDWSDKW